MRSCPARPRRGSDYRAGEITDEAAHEEYSAWFLDNDDRLRSVLAPVA